VWAYACARLLTHRHWCSHTDNDNLHGPRSQTGKVTLTQGAHEIQIQFFESGGGSVLKVSWKPPGGGMRRLSNRVLSNTIGCPCNQGLFFEAYSPDKDTAAKLNGKGFNWQTLASTESTVYDHVWNGWTPIVAHTEKVGRIWYPNDQAFVKVLYSSFGRNSTCRLIMQL
jgi:hypothetical protein